jgi:hypothetical protein
MNRKKQFLTINNKVIEQIEINVRVFYKSINMDNQRIQYHLPPPPPLNVTGFVQAVIMHLLYIGYRVFVIATYIIC